mmetsp:Transcript_17146/g.22260  ORF Transcript_17146/g.22260 Transcript_17146/m.22260 type:complete len:447 (+) Transcript_17146:130-1470(+)
MSCYCQKIHSSSENNQADCLVPCESGNVCRYGGWFHLECTKLKRIPRKGWRCRDCEELLEAAIRKVNAEEELSYSFSTPFKNKGKITDLMQQQSFSRKKRKGDHQSISSLQLVATKEKKKCSAHLEPELTVECAERQSREFVDSLLSQALPCTFEIDGSLVDDFECAGLCRLEISSHTFSHLQRLHKLIVRRLDSENRLTSWAGVHEGDARARGYAFLPSSFGKSFGEAVLKCAGVQFHAASKFGKDAKIDEKANWQSCIHLHDYEIDSDLRQALASITNSVRAAIPRKYKSLVHLNKLHAIQPNLHNGLDHLPPHLDYPLHDGFGVVIVTVCIEQDATILIVPHGQTSLLSTSPSSSTTRRRSRPRAFECKQGQAYVLAGNARNFCDHGVVCPLPSTRSKNIIPPNTNPIALSRGRESLNLRFGIHSNDPTDLFYAKREMPQLYQ